MDSRLRGNDVFRVLDMLLIERRASAAGQIFLYNIQKIFGGAIEVGDVNGRRIDLGAAVCPV